MLASLQSMTLLQKMAHEQAETRESLRQSTRRELRAALREFVPGQDVIVFGSLTKPQRFSELSDVDIAWENQPARLSVYQLTSRLAELLGRPVDVVLLAECRFRERVLREGEVWTPPA